MSRCSHCGVEILDDTEHCPLCHNVLENTGRGRMTYPNVLHKIKKINFLFRLFLFLAIILAVAVVAANFVYHPETWWSVIFIAAEVYGIIMLYLFTKDTGYRIRIIVGIFGFLLFDILADRITGYEKLAELPALSAGSGAVWTCGSAFCLSRLDYFSGTFGDCLLYQHSGLSGNGHSRRQDGPQ